MNKLRISNHRDDDMPIEITIVKSPRNMNVAKTSHAFFEQGGTLGRGPSNAWVLDDPDKYMSSTHTQISYENGQYVLIDLSTNGTFLNGAEEPLGNGNKMNLNQGDRFAISDYEFTVNITAGTSDDILSHPVGSNPFSDVDLANHHPVNHFATSTFPQNDPFGMAVNQSDAISSLDQVETDPLAVLDKANSDNLSSLESNPLPELGFGDTGSVASGAIEWPNANIESGMIPDDWDTDDLMSSELAANSMPSTKNATPITSTPEPISSNVVNVNLSQKPGTETLLKSQHLVLKEENKQLMSQIVKLELSLKKYKAKSNAENSTNNTSTKRSIDSQDQTLIESMGLAKWNLEEDKIIQISKTVGIMVRETMEGMMRVLKFRKKIKEEFRINVTTIQPIENNPLKFSANVDDAMENMFIKENKAYKEPVAALREGFQGVAEHQIAVLAGIQAAFRGMLDRLDPLNLEKRFEKYKKPSLISLGQKGKSWESYQKYHKGLIDNLDDSFQHLFGYDFVQAYEDQMQRLVSTRLSKKNQ